MITKQKKVEIVNGIKDIITRPSVIFVNFHGLPVEDVTKVRSELRKKGVRYLVAKKTLTRKAFEGSDVKGEAPEMEGELALVYPESKEAGDITAPAREIYAFQKKYAEKLSLVGGIFDGSFVDKAKMLDIAQIPDIKTLRAQFVNIINSPIQGFAVAIKAIADSKEQKV
jgi:large subunit ribosomal protein L10